MHIVAFRMVPKVLSVAYKYDCEILRPTSPVLAFSVTPSALVRLSLAQWLEYTTPPRCALLLGQILVHPEYQILFRCSLLHKPSVAVTVWVKYPFVSHWNLSLCIASVYWVVFSVAAEPHSAETVLLYLHLFNTYPNKQTWDVIDVH